jgi:AraC-like DNA-binding protein
VFSTLDTDDVNISFNTVDNEVQIVYSGECNTLSDAAKTQLLKPNFLAVNNTDSPFSFASSKLPLAKVIVELHDGRFITDITDNVVHITISLPQYHQTADAVSADATSTADSVTASNSALVLIVERETNSMREAKERLKLHHNVISVQSPELAFEMLRQNKIDIIVSEYNLKGMSGIDFCNIVKRDAAFTVPVLLVSRYLSNSLRVSAMNAGVTMIVEEPYKVVYLEACVNSVLSRIDSHIDEQNTIDQGVESPQLTETDVNFIRNLDSVVMANISEADFDNDVLAQKMYTSKSTLTRRVKTILGTTPNEYIRHKRLLLASQMLTKPDCRINEVCYAVGFNTPSYFAKCFKQAYGLLPQEYRDQIVHTRDTEHCSDSNES